MKQEIFIIGHQSPDLDSIAAAITYAEYKNQTDSGANYVPAAAGPINKVTEFVLQKFGLAAPAVLESAAGKKLILVDHNEASQQVNGSAESEIIEILDHHIVNFSGKNPIRIDVWPIGSSNSIIYKKFKAAGLEIDQKLAGLMLSAVLDDTVITKSPTCTEEDKVIILELAKLAGIEDWQGYGIEMFKAKANINKLSAAEIVKMDFKDYQMKAGKFGVGQVETVDLKDFEAIEDKLLEELGCLFKTGSYHSAILFITDIIKEGSIFLVVSTDFSKIEMALEKKLENKKVYIEGIISRKKQVMPKLTAVFDK